MNSDEFWKMLKTVTPDKYAKIVEQKKDNNNRRERETENGILDDFIREMSRKMKDADDQVFDSLIFVRLDLKQLLDSSFICLCPEMRRKYEEHGQSVGNAVQIRANLDGLGEFYEANKGLFRHIYLEDDGRDVVIRLTNRERVKKFGF